MAQPEKLNLEDENLHLDSRDCDSSSEDALPESEGLTKTISSDDDITSGEFVLRTLFAEFTILAETKIELVLAEPLERPLSKTLQRGEDPQFDQLLSSLNIVAEYSLLSLLKTLFKWYEKQQNVKLEDDVDGSNKIKNTTRPKSGADSPKPVVKSSKGKDYLAERRDLAVDFLFCLVLIEILKQLSVYPIDDEHLQYIESLAFRHFKQRNNDSASPSAANSQVIAALYAEVIGVLAMARFPGIRKRFTAEFKEHQNNPSTLINLIYGMKYLRIKLFPVEELEEGFLFLRECAAYFIDTKEKDIKFAFASVFVEILLPVAAYANRELNVPALKNFVDMMFHHALDLAKVKRNIQSTYPLVTVLLCVSQKAFFLCNWFNFLTQCLASVRQRDVKIQRIALECLYRLVWVYVVRIKCENNTTTVSRLRSITEVLFPRGAKTVVPSPKDVPLSIFVKIIQFIAQEKLDFAMNDIVFDLLGIGRTTRQISPERMNIGLRAFFVIADNLQRKGGEAPPMPSTISTLPSGNTIRVKKITLPKTLTEKAANTIGLANYYHSVRKALDSILRGLDSQVGKPMVMTNPHCSHKEDDMITGERKPKIDLFRTCIAVIPRCIPEGMTKTELVDFLSRLTMHMDEELRGLAFQSLQTLVMDVSDWREVVILGFVNFILKDIQDNFHFLPLLDNALRMLLQLLAIWKQALSSSDSLTKNGEGETLELSSHALPSDKEMDAISVLHSVEGCALVMLCNSKPSIRRLTVIVLREVKTIFPLVDPDEKKRKDKIVMDVIEQIFPTVLDKTLNSFAQSDKLFSGQLGNIDILVMNDRLCTFADQESSEQMLTLCSDLWLNLLAGLLEKNYLPESCPSALQFSWPSVLNRLLNVYAIIDPGASGMDSITSLSAMYNRGPKKISNMGDTCLWRNYLVYACCTHPKAPQSISDSPDQDHTGERTEGTEKGDSRPPSPHMVDSLFRFAVPLLKSDCPKIRESIIIGLGRTSPSSYRDFIEEVHFLVREALDRKAENVRKRRKRDSLRSYLTKVFELNAQFGCFADSDSELIKEGSLISFFIDYIDGIRLYLESEPDKDWPAVMNLRLHFCNFVYKLITSVSKTQQESLLPLELRRNLFFLFSSWCAHFGVKIPNVDRPLLIPSAQSNDLELATLHAMCGILQCGSMFDSDGISHSGYLYSWLKLVLNSPKEKIHLLGRNTLTRLLENNSTTPQLLNWVIDKCYTGTKLVASGCFRALCSVFTKRTDYPCEMIPLLNVVLFKTADTCIDLREKAAQLLQLLERRFFKYTPPSISCSAHCSYSQSQSELSAALAKAHPEITVYMFEEMTSRFQSTIPAGQRCILQYMLPWLANIELVDLVNPPSIPTLETEHEQDEEKQSEILMPIELNGEGWGSFEATRLVLNNLFYITVKYDDQFSKEIESAWASLVCGRWISNVHEIMSYLITLSGVVGQSEVLIHAKKLAVYIARAQTDQTVEDLMEELKLTETIASQFERSTEPPYFKAVSKTTCSRDSVCEQPDAKTTTQPNNNKQDDDVKKEAKDEKKTDSLPRVNSQEKGSPSADYPDMAPLAEPEDVEDVNQKIEPFEDACWPQEWVVKVYKLGGAFPLPVPDKQKYFAPLDDVLPFASAAASLYRCNFALMVLTELVLDQPQVEWGRHVPLMLHLIFLGLDHGKALVYEHCKRLLVNLVIIMVCHGNYIHIAQPLSDFMAGTEESLGKHGQLQKSVWTLDIGSMVRLPTDSSETSAGTGDEQRKQPTDNTCDDDKHSVKFTAGGELPTDNGPSKHLQVKSLIEFLANSISKPLWSFEDITPRNYKIKSAEQMEVFLALVIHIFSTSDIGLSVQEDWAKVALHWATTCSSRHYAGRSFQVFRALKVPLSWPMLSDVLSRLVESVGDNSEDVQGYVMEILLTVEACADWMMYDSTNDTPSNRPVIPHGLRDQDEKDLDQYDELANVLSPLSTSDRTPLSSRTGFLNNENMSIRHIRSLSSGCDVRRALGFYSHMSRISHQNNDVLRARSASVQCLRITNELSQQTQTDMITRVFWIAVSLFESDYDHEYLMAIELVNQVMTFLNLSRHEPRERLEKVLHRLNWPDFPGLQSLVLKGLTSAGTSDASLRLLARLTEFTDVAIVDPSQVSGFGLNILALLPYMAEHFDEPDEFSKTCATNIIQVCCRTSSLNNLGKMFRMYVDKMYHRPRSTWIDVVCKYIHDSYSRYSKPFVSFLLEVLEFGPQSYQESVLAILCALIKLIDFSSVTMKQFHNEVLKVISKYLKGNYWKESLEILKLAVSNSSNLDTPPPRPPSTIWSNYESSWAIDAVPIKKELPGRTLEFTYDLSLVPVIGQKSQVGVASEQAKPALDIPASRKPNTSQRRTRDRLVQVLQTCGHTVGLKQSPSVVFSSSSDLAVEKPSDHQSSSEDINNDSRKEDQIIGEINYFDFLDDVSIESNDESGFVVWPVEDNHRFDNLQSIDKAMLPTNSFSGSDLDLTTPHDSSDDDDELNRSMNEGSVSTTCAAVESESAAESAAESVGELEHESSTEHEVVIDVSEDNMESDRDFDRREQDSTSTESAAGTSPGGEYTIYAVTESFSTIDDVQSLWTDHVSFVVKDTTGVTAVNTYALFWSLYQSIRRKFYSLTRECCNYLDEKFREVSQHFCNTLEFLVARGDCPYVCLDTETLKKTRLFDKQKFMTLELNDHYVNFIAKSDKTTECLDIVKLALKRTSVGSPNDEPEVCPLDKVTHEQRQLDLCRSLYQMHFQFLLLCSTFSRLLDALVNRAQLGNISDHTARASNIRTEIASALDHLPQLLDEPYTLTNELETLTPSAALQLLVDRLISKDIEQAVHLLRLFRERFTDGRFGKSDDDNLDVLVILFCRQIAEKDVGSLIMSSQATQFAGLCNELMDVNVSALAALEELVFP